MVKVFVTLLLVSFIVAAALAQDETEYEDQLADFGNFGLYSYFFANFSILNTTYNSLNIKIMYCQNLKLLFRIVFFLPAFLLILRMYDMNIATNIKVKVGAMKRRVVILKLNKLLAQNTLQILLKHYKSLVY